MSKSFHLPFPPALSPIHPRPHQHPKATICPTTPHVHASKQARAQASAVNKKTTHNRPLHLRFATPRIKKRRAAFSAASKVIKTRCNNQSRRRGGSASRTGGGEKKKKYFRDAGYRTAWTDMYMYTFNEDNSILSSFLLFFFFFFRFVLHWPRKCYWNTIAVQV